MIHLLKRVIERFSALVIPGKPSAASRRQVFPRIYESQLENRRVLNGSAIASVPLDPVIVDAGSEAGDGDTDYFEIRRDPQNSNSRIQVVVNDVVRWEGELSEVQEIEIQGSSDRDVIKIDSSLEWQGTVRVLGGSSGQDSDEDELIIYQAEPQTLVNIDTELSGGEVKKLYQADGSNSPMEIVATDVETVSDFSVSLKQTIQIIGATGEWTVFSSDPTPPYDETLLGIHSLTTSDLALHFGDSQEIVLGFIDSEAASSLSVQQFSSEALALEISGININVVGGIDIGDSGEIRLDAGAARDLKIQGVLDVSGAAGPGGRIVLLGEHISLLDLSQLNASGADGGGFIGIGGESVGADLFLSETKTISIQSGALVQANADDSGNGGDIFIWSQELTRIEGNGNIQAIGSASGQGGLVRTFALGVLQLDDVVVLGAAGVQPGRWEIEAPSLLVGSSLPAAGDTESVLVASAIARQLNAGGSVKISATGGVTEGNVRISESINQLETSDSKLEIFADGRVEIDGNVQIGGGDNLSLVLNAGAGIDAEFAVLTDLRELQLLAAGSNISIGTLNLSAESSSGDLGLKSVSERFHSSGLLKLSGRDSLITTSATTGIGIEIRELDSGSGILQLVASSEIHFSGGAVSIRSDEGQLIIRGAATDTTIGLGDGVAGDITLNSASLSAIDAGFGKGIVLGSEAQQGEIRISGTGYEFQNSLIVRANGGAGVFVDGVLNFTQNAEFQVNGSTDTILTIDGNILTDGGQVSVSTGAVHFQAAGERIIQTSGGGINFSQARLVALGSGIDLTLSTYNPNGDGGNITLGGMNGSGDGHFSSAIIDSSSVGGDFGTVRFNDTNTSIVEIEGDIDFRNSQLEFDNDATISALGINSNLMLGAVRENFDKNLVLNSSGNIETNEIELGQGSLTINIDVDGDSLSSFTANGKIDVGLIEVNGSTAGITDDIAVVRDSITTSVGSIVFKDLAKIELASEVSMYSAADVLANDNVVSVELSGISGVNRVVAQGSNATIHLASVAGEGTVQLVLESDSVAKLNSVLLSEGALIVNLGGNTSHTNLYFQANDINVKDIVVVGTSHNHGTAEFNSTVTVGDGGLEVHDFASVTMVGNVTSSGEVSMERIGVVLLVGNGITIQGSSIHIFEDINLIELGSDSSSFTFRSEGSQGAIQLASIEATEVSVSLFLHSTGDIHLADTELSGESQFEAMIDSEAELPPAVFSAGRIQSGSIQILGSDGSIHSAVVNGEWKSIAGGITISGFHELQIKDSVISADGIHISNIATSVEVGGGLSVLSLSGDVEIHDSVQRIDLLDGMESFQIQSVAGSVNLASLYSSGLTQAVEVIAGEDIWIRAAEISNLLLLRAEEGSVSVGDLKLGDGASESEIALDSTSVSFSAGGRIEAANRDIQIISTSISGISPGIILGAVDAGNGQVLLAAASEIQMNGGSGSVVSTGGKLSIRGLQVSTTLGVGDTASGLLRIKDSSLLAIGSGFAQGIEFGSQSQTGTIDFSGIGLGFINNLSIFADGGASVHFGSDLELTGPGSTLQVIGGSDSVVTLAGSVYTNGGDIVILGGALLIDGTSLRVIQTNYGGNHNAGRVDLSGIGQIDGLHSAASFHILTAASAQGGDVLLARIVAEQSGLTELSIQTSGAGALDGVVQLDSIRLVSRDGSAARLRVNNSDVTPGEIYLSGRVDLSETDSLTSGGSIDFGTNILRSRFEGSSLELLAGNREGNGGEVFLGGVAGDASGFFSSAIIDTSGALPIQNGQVIIQGDGASGIFVGGGVIEESNSIGIKVSGNLVLNSESPLVFATSVGAFDGINTKSIDLSAALISGNANLSLVTGSLDPILEAGIAGHVLLSSIDLSWAASSLVIDTRGTTSGRTILGSLDADFVSIVVQGGIDLVNTSVTLHDSTRIATVGAGNHLKLSAFIADGIQDLEIGSDEGFALQEVLMAGGTLSILVDSSGDSESNVVVKGTIQAGSVSISGVGMSDDTVILEKSITTTSGSIQISNFQVVEIEQDVDLVSAGDVTIYDRVTQLTLTGIAGVNEIHAKGEEAILQLGNVHSSGGADLELHSDYRVDLESVVFEQGALDISVGKNTDQNNLYFKAGEIDVSELSLAGSGAGQGSALFESTLQTSSGGLFVSGFANLDLKGNVSSAGEIDVTDVGTAVSLHNGLTLSGQKVSIEDGVVIIELLGSGNQFNITSLGEGAVLNLSSIVAVEENTSLHLSSYGGVALNEVTLNAGSNFTVDLFSANGLEQSLMVMGGIRAGSIDIHGRDGALQDAEFRGSLVSTDGGISITNFRELVFDGESGDGLESAQGLDIQSISQRVFFGEYAGIRANNGDVLLSETVQRIDVQNSFTGLEIYSLGGSVNLGALYSQGPDRSVRIESEGNILLGHLDVNNKIDLIAKSGDISIETIDLGVGNRVDGHAFRAHSLTFHVSGLFDASNVNGLDRSIQIVATQTTDTAISLSALQAGAAIVELNANAKIEFIGGANSFLSEGGKLIIQGLDASTTIGIGDTATGMLTVDDESILAIGAGFTEGVEFGSAMQIGTVDVAGNSLQFANSLRINAGGGADVLLRSGLSIVEEGASLTIVGSDVTTVRLAGPIETLGGDVVVMGGELLIDGSETRQIKTASSASGIGGAIDLGSVLRIDGVNGAAKFELDSSGNLRGGDVRLGRIVDSNNGLNSLVVSTSGSAQNGGVYLEAIRLIGANGIASSLEINALDASPVDVHLSGAIDLSESTSDVSGGSINLGSAKLVSRETGSVLELLTSNSVGDGGEIKLGGVASSSTDYFGKVVLDSRGGDAGGVAGRIYFQGEGDREVLVGGASDELEQSTGILIAGEVVLAEGKKLVLATNVGDSSNLNSKSIDLRGAVFSGTGALTISTASMTEGTTSGVAGDVLLSNVTLESTGSILTIDTRGQVMGKTILENQSSTQVSILVHGQLDFSHTTLELRDNASIATIGTGSDLTLGYVMAQGNYGLSLLSSENIWTQAIHLSGGTLNVAVDTDNNSTSTFTSSGEIRVRSLTVAGSESLNDKVRIDQNVNTTHGSIWLSNLDTVEFAEDVGMISAQNISIYDEISLVNFVGTGGVNLFRAVGNNALIRLGALNGNGNVELIAESDHRVQMGSVSLVNGFVDISVGLNTTNSGTYFSIGQVDARGLSLTGTSELRGTAEYNSGVRTGAEGLKISDLSNLVFGGTVLSSGLIEVSNIGTQIALLNGISITGGEVSLAQNVNQIILQGSAINYSISSTSQGVALVLPEIVASSTASLALNSYGDIDIARVTLNSGSSFQATLRSTDGLNPSELRTNSIQAGSVSLSGGESAIHGGIVSGALAASSGNVSISNFNDLQIDSSIDANVRVEISQILIGVSFGSESSVTAGAGDIRIDNGVGRIDIENDEDAFQFLSHAGSVQLASLYSTGEDRIVEVNAGKHIILSNTSIQNRLEVTADFYGAGLGEISVTGVLAAKELALHAATGIGGASGATVKSNSIAAVNSHRGAIRLANTSNSDAVWNVAGYLGTNIYLTQTGGRVVIDRVATIADSTPSPTESIIKVSAINAEMLVRNSGVVAGTSGSIELSTSANRSIVLDGVVSAGSSNVSINAGSTLSGDGIIRAASIDLTSGQGIGVDSAVRTEASVINAISQSGSVKLHNQYSQLVVLSGIESGSSGSVEMTQTGGGDLWVMDASTGVNGGNVEIANESGTVYVVGTTKAGGTGNLLLSASRDIVLETYSVAQTTHEQGLFIANAGGGFYLIDGATIHVGAENHSTEAMLHRIPTRAVIHPLVGIEGVNVNSLGIATFFVQLGYPDAINIDKNLGIYIDWSDGEYDDLPNGHKSDQTGFQHVNRIDADGVPFAILHRYLEHPNSEDPTARIPVTFRLTTDTLNRIQISDSLNTAALLDQVFVFQLSVPHSGIHSLLGYVPEVQPPPRETQFTPIHVPASAVVHVTQQSNLEMPSSVSEVTSKSDRRYVIRLVILVNEDGDVKESDSIDITEEDIADLPQLFKRLGDNRYRIYSVLDNGIELLLRDFYLKRNVPIEVDDGSVDEQGIPDLPESERTKSFDGEIHSNTSEPKVGSNSERKIDGNLGGHLDPADGDSSDVVEESSDSVVSEGSALSSLAFVGGVRSFRRAARRLRNETQVPVKSGSEVTGRRGL